MSTSARVRTGAATLIQEHLGERLVHNLVNIMPWMFILMAKDGNKVGTTFGLGRPSVGQVFAGVRMSKAKRMEILGTDKYMPLMDTALPPASDGKVLGQRDTMPEPTDPVTNYAGSTLVRPFHKWVERADPIHVWKKDIRRTKKQNGGTGPRASAAIGDLWRYQTDRTLSTHLKWWNTKFWGDYTIAPSNVDAEVWDSPYSIAATLKTDTNYGGVDRSISGNDYLAGNYVTAHQPADVVNLVHQANYTYNCAKLGVGIDLLICGLDLFPQFINQVDALKGQVIYDGKLPGIGEFGFTREVLRYRNTWIVMDPECPSLTRGDTKNVVVGLNMDTWTVAVSPDANFEADDPFDLSKTRGGQDALKSQMRTELIACNENPKVNIYWEDVG